MTDNVTVTKVINQVQIASDGPQGPTGPTGATGPSGVISVTAPITNTGTSTSAIIGINAGVAGGVATLDGTGKVPQNQLPAVAITNTFVVNSQAAMLALTAEEGDVAVRTDLNKSFILSATPSSTLANWQELLTPTDSVLSVDGLTGAVDLTTKYAQLATANTFTGGVQQITTASAATKGLIVKATVSQTANLVEAQESTSAILGGISAVGSFFTTGRVSVGYTSAQGGYKGLFTGNTSVSDVILGVRGMASQTADLQQWQNSAGTVLARVYSGGQFLMSGLDVTTGGAGITGNYANTDTLQVIINSAARRGILVKGAASQTANLQEWQDSTGTVLARVGSDGGSRFPYLGGLSAGLPLLYLGGGPSNAHRIDTNAAANIGFVVRGAASQTASLQEWQISDGTVRSRIDSNGYIIGGFRSSFGNFGGIVSGVAVAISADAATTIPIVARGAASQTANLQQWQNSAGTVLASVLAGGNITATDFRTANTLALIGEANSGGRIYMAKASSANSNPGAGIAVMYYRDGTNAGTLKLVVRAGAAGAETTILDNIPQ